MTISLQQIAIRNAEILVPAPKADIGDLGKALLRSPSALTVLGNLAHLGYALDETGVRGVLAMSDSDLRGWWGATEQAVRAETFADRDMGAFTVYKNFPREVIEMDRAEYWARQILMYLGLPNALFTETEEARAPKLETPKPRVLKAVTDTLMTYVGTATRRLWTKTKSWTDPEREMILALAEMTVSSGKMTFVVNISEFPFRGNGVTLAAHLRTDPRVKITARDATDALRLAQTIAAPATPKRVVPKPFAYGQPAPKRSPRPKALLGPIARADRRLICGLLEGSPTLEGDAARRPAEFKALLRRLRPGDFDAPRVQAVYDDLYNGRLKGAQAGVENAVKAKDADAAFAEAAGLPAGVRLRRFRKLYELDAVRAVRLAVDALPGVDTGAVLAFAGQVRAMNGATFRVATPKGEWRKAQISKNDGVRIAPEHVSVLEDAARDLVAVRLADAFPAGVRRMPDFDRLAEVKLPENGQALATYGRGTTFPIPQEPGFIRTASYWEHKAHGNTWFDNGMTLISDGFADVSAVCWTNERQMVAGGEHAAVFSGDPSNSKEMRGRGCQMIDLYPENRGQWRYAVWNVLCYSGVKFADASGEVLATLQVGADPQSGNLYEPSRALFKFPLQRDALTSYVAVADMQTRTLTYLDMDLGGTTQSADRNREIVKEKIPAVLDVLSFRPSWHDLMSALPEGPDGVPVGYADHGVKAEKALCFSQEDPEAAYAALPLSDLLGTTGGAYTRPHGPEGDASPAP